MLAVLCLGWTPQRTPVPHVVRCGRIAAQLPIELRQRSVDLQRKLGEGSFAEVTAGSTDVDAVIGGRALTSVSSARVQVGLFYGQLTSGEAAGTRVLVKAYSPSDQPPWAEEPSTDVRAQLEAALSASGGDGNDGSLESKLDSLESKLESLQAGKLESLEAGLSTSKRSGASLAEALALNEFAAHCRVQRTGDSESRGIARMVGRLIEKDENGTPMVLHVFPWRGEQVRMALPTRLPPTIGSWLAKIERGETDGQKKWTGVPVKAARQRGKFVRAALRDALRGLDALHAAGLVHQGLGPSAVLLSTEDDFNKGGAARGALQELGFARDAASLYPAHWLSTDGLELSPYGEAAEAGNAAADPLELGLAERALRRTVRPGDPFERARYARADDMREFGLLLLAGLVLPNAPPGAIDQLKLRSLTDGPFVGADADGMKTDGVDVPQLREYLDADDGLRIGGVGGVELLDTGGAGSSGWDLLALLLHPEWDQRPSAAEALAHPFFDAEMAIY